MRLNSAFFHIAFVYILASLVFTHTIKAEILNIGYFDFPPHVITENHKATGVAVDYFNLIRHEMKIRDVNYKSIPMKRLMDLLESGQIDIGLFFAKTPERAAKFIYPKEAFTSLVIALALKKTHPLISIRTVEDILPLKLGFFKGGYLPPMLQDKRLTIEYLYEKNWTILNLQKVKRGRLDAAISTYYQMEYEAKKHGMLEDFKFLKVPDSDAPIYSVMSESCAKKYLRLYENALIKVKREKSYSQVFEEFINKPYE